MATPHPERSAAVNPPIDADARRSRDRLRLLMHGAAVAVVGLVSGFGLVFVILGSVTVWPVTLHLATPFPGTEHGWRIAHVAGVMNGMLMMICGLALPHIGAGRRTQSWIVWSLVYTGWGNTIFFHCANFSNNRALSAGVTRFGPADLAGKVGYVIGGSTIPFTISALTLIAFCAWRQLRRT